MSSRDFCTGPTIGELTLRTLLRYPQRTAFSRDGGHLTYRQAFDLIGRYQAALERAHVRPGSTVAILGGNRAEIWCAGVAVHVCGAALTWLHPLGSSDDHLFQIVDVEADAVIVDEVHHEPRGGELAAKCSAIGVSVFSVSASTFAPDLDSLTIDVACTGPRDRACVSGISSINYTGGTTGRPKGVVRRHTPVIQQALQVLANFELPESPRYLQVAPLSHVAGTKILPTLARGGTVHLLNGFSPERVIDTVARERINFTVLVPAMIYGLLDDPGIARADMSSLELVLYGASPMSVHRLQEGIDRLGPVFSQLYGQTECYPISLLRRSDHDPNRPERLSSCGFPLVGNSVAILDANGERVAPGESGELCVRSANSMESYWKQEQLTEDTLAHGWLHTGDIARIDDDGYLYIVDRKKDMIISGGFNVYPREVEDALTAHEAVSAAAVYGVDHEKWGEAVTATVVLRPGAKTNEEALIAHVKARKGSVQAPKRIFFVDQLPVTGVGKIDKRALRA